MSGIFFCFFFHPPPPLYYVNGRVNFSRKINSTQETKRVMLFFTDIKRPRLTLTDYLVQKNTPTNCRLYDIYSFKLHNEYKLWYQTNDCIGHTGLCWCFWYLSKSTDLPNFFLWIKPWVLICTRAHLQTQPHAQYTELKASIRDL